MKDITVITIIPYPEPPKIPKLIYVTELPALESDHPDQFTHHASCAYRHDASHGCTCPGI